MLNFLKKNYLIISILLIAAFFRLFNIYGYAEFLGDQGRDLIIIRDFLVNHNLFFIGPQTSIGNMYLGPYFYYLIAPSLWLSNFDPIGPAIFIALIGIATVYLVFYLVKKIFDHLSAAYLAAFFYAISPVVIKYSTFSWNPNIMPFFTLLFVLFIYQAFFEKKYQYLIYASLAFIMCFNSHFLSLLLLPLAGIYWLKEIISLKLSKDTKNLNKLLLSTLAAVLVFLISLLPLVLFDLKHQGQNINAFINFFRYRETTVNLKVYKGLFQIVPVASSVFTSLFSLTSKYSVFSFIFAFVSLTLLYFFQKPKNLSKFIFLFLWLAIGLVGLGLYKQHLYAHYYGFIFPVPFIIMALLIVNTIQNKYLLVIIALALSPLLITQTHLFTTPQNQIDHARVLADSITSNVTPKDGRYNLVLLASYNDFRAQAPRYFLIKNNQSNLLGLEEYPQSDTLFVIQDDPKRWSNPLMTDIWELNSYSPFMVKQTFTSPNNVTIYKIFKQ